MQLIALSCNHCGSPIEAPDDARFVTCGYCGSRLAVKHSGNAHYTEVLEAIGRQTEQIAGDVQVIRLQNELEQLDRDWEKRSERLAGPHGDVRASKGSKVFLVVFGIIVAVISGVVGIGFIVIPGIGLSDAPDGVDVFLRGFQLVGLVVVLSGIAFAIGIPYYGIKRADAYSRALRKYQHRRRTLLRKIEGRAPGSRPDDFQLPPLQG